MLESFLGFGFGSSITEFGSSDPILRAKDSDPDADLKQLKLKKR